MNILTKKAGRQAKGEAPKWADNAYTIVLPDSQRENLKFSELETLIELIKFALGPDVNNCAHYEQIGRIVEHTTIHSPLESASTPGNEHVKKTVKTLTHYLIDDYGTCLIDKNLVGDVETAATFKLKEYDSLNQKTLFNLLNVLILIVDEGVKR